MDIVALTEAQRLLLEELNKLLDKEKDILIHDRCDELLSIIDAKADLSHKLSIVEEKRQELYPGKKAESFIKEGTLDEKTLMDLKLMAISAKEKSDVNMALTRQSLNYIKAITSALDTRQKTLTYGNTGKLEDDSSASLFSQKI
jgi:flagellar biosynthesis/type III secretory pathway chaperone